jgi:hypothetical protein
MKITKITKNVTVTDLKQTELIANELTVNREYDNSFERRKIHNSVDLISK